jgi:hypothetical protein
LPVLRTLSGVYTGKYRPLPWGGYQPTSCGGSIEKSGKSEGKRKKTKGKREFEVKRVK